MELRPGKIEAKELGDDWQLLELNFSRYSTNEDEYVQKTAIPDVLPRFQLFCVGDNIMTMKRRIYERIKGIFQEHKCPADQGPNVRDYWINSHILLYIKDNTAEDPENRGEDVVRVLWAPPQ